MQPISDCPKCQGRMTEGFIIDEGYGTAHVSTWQGGEPKRSIWTGLKKNKDEQFKVVAYRCSRCGFLESYARESVK